MAWRYGEGWTNIGDNEETLNFTVELMENIAKQKEEEKQRHNKVIKTFKKGQEEKRLAKLLGDCVNLSRFEEVERLLNLDEFSISCYGFLLFPLWFSQMSATC